VILIGEIAVAFGAIEGSAAFMSALLVGPDIGTGLLVGAGDPLAGHLDRLERLARYRIPKPLADETVKWCKEVRKALAPERNVILHGAWITQDPTELYKMVRKRGGGVSREDFTLDRLRSVRDLATRLLLEALALAREVDMAPKWAVWLREPGRDRPRWEEEFPPIPDGTSD
jgi:hypothetical protein